MQVTFSMDADDVAAHLAENQLGVFQMSTTWTLSLLSLSLLPTSLLLAFFGEWWLVAIGWGLAILGLGGLIGYAWLNLGAQEPTPPFESTFRFLEDCVEESGKDYLIRLSWQMIPEIRVTEKHLLLVVASTEWVAPRRFTAVIPRRAFESEEAAEHCAEFCRERIAAWFGRPIVPLVSRPEIWPEIFRQSWQGDCLELRYRHPDDGGRQLDPDGQDAQRGLLRILSLYPLAIMIFLGMTLTVFMFQESDGFERAFVGLAAFLIIPWFVLGILQGIVRAYYPLEPPAVLNPQVSLILHSQGMYFRTEVSEGFIPSSYLPNVEEGEDFLFFRSSDGAVSRVVPRTAFVDEDQMRHFMAAVEAARENIVMAVGVNRVPPSDNPYRPPENV